MSDNNEAQDAQLFALQRNENFGEIGPEDDLLHPDSFRGIQDDTATETQFFGFRVPEARVHGYAYLWHHPNLRVCTGGLIVFQGVKATTAHAELCDYRTFMSDTALKNDLHEYRLDNGYGVRIIEPLKRFHMTYSDPGRGNMVDLHFDAVQPAVMFGNGRHFEQTMKVDGKISLRGTRYEVDCFSIRDRSWGAARSEAPLDKPPLSWICVVFDEDFAFNCTVFDQMDGNPGTLAMDEKSSLSGGWIFHDGRRARVVNVAKRAWRNHPGTVCERMQLKLTDDLGREFEMEATLVASCPLILWNNNWMVINLMRWECNGRIGYGDTQEGFWSSYLSGLPSTAPAAAAVGT